MSNPSQSQLDINTLGWVKSEIDDTLNQARSALETFVESPDDDSQLRFCINYLHQVHGTLQMVELYGAAMVAEEMEAVTQALLDNQIGNREDAYEILMRGILQLPDYLERLQSGAKDMPVLLLPLLNDLRATRGDALLTENALFQPDLSVEAPLVSTVGEQAEDLPQLARTLRHTYHLGLLGWFREKDTPGSLQKLQGVVDQLREAANDAEASRMLWVASGVIEGLRDGGLESSVAVKLLLGNLDRQIKQIIDQGESSLQDTPPVELLKNLLYYVSRAEPRGELVKELKGAFNLKDVLPDAQSIEKARADMTGPNQALMSTVSAVLVDDLTKVKDSLDVFVRTDDKNVDTLRELGDTLTQMSDTLGMLGLGIQRQEVLNQLDILNEMVSGKAEINDVALMDVAGALLAVENALGDLSTARVANEKAAVAEAEGSTVKAPDQQLMQSVIAEARAELNKVKEALNDFSRTPSRPALLNDVPEYMSKIQGSLAMLDLHQAAELLAVATHYIEVSLIPGDNLPEDESLEVLADAISSIEYYLESLVEGWGHPEAILQVAQQSLTQLGVVTGTGLSGGAGESGEEEGELGEISDSDLVNQTLDNLERPDLSGIDEEAGYDSRADTLVDMPATETDEKTTINLDTTSGEHDFQTSETDPTLVDLPMPDMSIEEREGASSEEFKIESEGSAGPGLTLEGFDSDESLENNIQQPGETLQGDTTGDELDFDISAASAETDVMTPEASRSMAESAAASLLEEIDDEILEIFLEEAEEEQANIARNYPKWKANPENEEALMDMRRSFHTLKGSGRLVGAIDVGEFAWACENMLNRVIDNTVEPTPVMHELLLRVQEVLPQLFDGFRHGKQPDHEIFNLMDIAHALSQGKQVGDDALQQAQQAEPIEVTAPVETTQSEAIVEEATASEIDEDTQLIGEPQTETIDGFVIPPIDSALCDIYRNEAQLHLQTLREYILNAQDQKELGITHDLIRALHTLSGSSRTTGMAPVAKLSGLFEKYVKHLESAEASLHAQAIDVLEDYVEYVAEAAKDVDKAGEPLADHEPLMRRIDVLCNQAVADAGAVQAETSASEPAIAEEASVQEYDDELLEIFLEEGIEILDESDHTLHDWIKEPDNQEMVEALQRQLHTLKGGARMAGVAAIGDLSHAVESVLTAVVETKLATSQPMFDDLVRAQDRLVHMLDQLKQRQTLTPADDIEKSLEDLLRNPPAAASASMESSVEISMPEEEIESAQSEEWHFAPDLDLSAGPEVEIPTDELNESPQASAESLETDEASADLTVLDLEEPEVVGQEEAENSVPLTHLEGEATTEESIQDREPAENQVGDNVVSFEPKQAEPADELTVVEVEVAGTDESDPAAETMQEPDTSPEAISEPEPIAESDEETPGDETAELAPEDVTSDVEEELPGTDMVSPDRDNIESVSAEPEQAVDETAQPIAELESSSPADELPAETEREQPVRNRPQGEQVRVRSGLLDNLVNFAGEVSIYSSRLEQQNNTFRYNLVELNDTVTRLRDQLRNFEIEAETQIQFRYEEATGKSYGDFDPLEFDRFTQMQQLSRGMLESLSDLDSLRNMLGNLTRESETLLVQQSRINTELQEGLMRTRMVPFSSQVARLRRIVRQTCQELDKQAELHIHGMESELDRTVLERILAPLEHMLRNAIAHGIEAPARRKELGKKGSGRLDVNLTREGNDLVITMTDDGAGINLDAIRAQAVDRGLLDPDAQPDTDELIALIMESGFSTASEVTQISGRGVGMDVVNSEITRLGGLLNIETEADKGTQFIIRLPQSLSVTRALLVTVAEEVYAIPLLGVEGVERVDAEIVNQLQQSETQLYKWVGEDYRYMHLGAMLSNEASPAVESGRNVPLLLVRSGDFRAAIQVDGLIGSREVVVKPVGPQLSTLRGISGATIMGDGGVVLILDLGVLTRLVETSDMPIELVEAVPEQEAARLPLIMVVDDSITVRKVTTRLLERNDMEVVTAKDGVDALAQLHDIHPDVMLLDIEMPRMDGFELATNMRNDEQMSQIPIIMITSRTGEKHRQRAFSIGVNEYMGKPYQEGELIGTINQLLDEKKA